MNIIDVTLRDGGHLMNFDWDIDFAKEYYKLLTEIKGVDIIELGYWKQTSKSDKRFYNLNYEEVLNITNGSSNKNVSIMIDYHYCLKNVEEYPTDEQNEIVMIRLCSRKEDIDNALKFGEELKEYTNLNVSFNIFNVSNYTKEELDGISHKVSKSTLDYIYFADTHGSMDLEFDLDKFEYMINILKKHNKKIGFHLHDHNGKGYFNYRQLSKNGFDSTDTSIRGMGKGSGNLKLEHVINKEGILPITELIHKYSKFMKTNPTPYEIITSKYSVTDNYAKEAEINNISVMEFDEFCMTLENFNKDSYDSKLMSKWMINKT